MRHTLDQSPLRLASLAERLDGEGLSDPTSLRGRLVPELRSILDEGRAEAEAALLREGDGIACARRLSGLMDGIVRALHDSVVRHLYPADNPSSAEKLAVVATGGYGRGTLAPGSDVDLLFLLPYKQTAWGESVVEAMLYVLWDLKLKVGHATRSVDVCIREAKADMTIRTALLEARFLLGDPALYEALLARFDKEVVRGSAPEFVDAKLKERDARVTKAGASRYLVEPNVKDGKGGLRDLNTLFWISKYVYRVREPQELVEAGLFTPEELRLFERCEEFLWRVRCHMHFATGRAEERLGFELQRQLAERMGQARRGALSGVERFMKAYFRVAKEVGDLTAIVCAELEARQAKHRPMLDRMIGRFRRRRGGRLESDDFVVDYNRINLTGESAFERDPVNLIRLFWLADRHNLAGPPGCEPARDALARAHRPDAPQRPRGEPPVHGRPDLAQRAGGGAAADERGRGARALHPRFRPHRRDDAVQHVPPLHGRRASPALDRRARRDRRPAGRARAPALEPHRALDPEPAGALRGAVPARHRQGPHRGPFDRRRRHRPPARARGSASIRPKPRPSAWLVEHHLLMSTIAQSRDLSDPKTIETFAGVVQTMERLKLLLVLTIADIKAVGPGVWTGWKGELLRTLYYETEVVLTGGHSELARMDRVRRAQDELRAALPDWSDDAFAIYAQRHYPAYWLKVEPGRRVKHARFVSAAQAAGRTVATMVETDAFRGVTELTVMSPDHPRLLAIITGACAAGGGNIVDAQIFTTADGMALDTIFLSRAFELDTDELRRAERVATAIERALKGEVKIADLVAGRRPPREGQRTFHVLPEVVIDNALSSRQTVLEVSGLDRPGLLYDLTTVVGKLNLNIASAHIATFGEKAVDVFYVTDLTGTKITHPGRQAAIRRAMLEVFDGDAGAEQPLRAAAR